MSACATPDSPVLGIQVPQGKTLVVGSRIPRCGWHFRERGHQEEGSQAGALERGKTGGSSRLPQLASLFAARERPCEVYLIGES